MNTATTREIIKRKCINLRDRYQTPHCHEYSKQISKQTVSPTSLKERRIWCPIRIQKSFGRSFVTQCFDGIDARSPTRRNKTGSCRNHGKQRRDQKINERIEGVNFEQEILDSGRAHHLQ